jgi:hypothetical protein
VNAFGIDRLACQQSFGLVLFIEQVFIVIRHAVELDCTQGGQVYEVAG